MRTPLCEKFGIDVPLFAFSHCRDVVVAVSKAGGFGVLGALAFTPDELEQELVWIDEHIGDRPYGVDIVIPQVYVGRDQGDLDPAQLMKFIPDTHRQFLERLLEKHGVPPLPENVERASGVMGWSASKGRAHLEVALRHPVKLIANALGEPPADVIERAHAKGVLVAALVGRADQAIKQKNAGVDIIVAQGNEAGGHTGEISTMVLVPEVVDAVAPTPVLAAGGIGRGRQMAAALALGAQGAWTGSIWLTVRESEEPPYLVEKLLAATSSDTVRSRALTGKPARQLKTAYTEAWDSKESPGPLQMPLQIMATAEALQRIRRHANNGGPGSAALLGSPVGQIVGSMKSVRPARDVVFDIVSECADTLQKLGNDLAAVQE